MVFGRFKRKKDHGRVALHISEYAVSVARVSHEKAGMPCVELCDVEAVDNLAVSDAELVGLINRHRLTGYPCNLALGMGEYSLLLVEAPGVQPTELRSAIRWRIKELIDFHIDDAVVDVFEIPDQKAVARHCMMYAVVARSELVKGHIDSLLGAGIRLEVIDIPELALRNISALLPEDVGGVVLAYVGQHGGIINITRQATLYLSRRIETGLATLPEEDASQIEEGGAWQAWLDRFVIEIQRSIDYYDSHFPQPALSLAVITPLGDRDPGVTDYLAAQLGISVRYLDLNQLIDFREGIQGDMQSACLLPIGAALRREGLVL